MASGLTPYTRADFLREENRWLRKTIGSLKQMLQVPFHPMIKALGIRGPSSRPKQPRHLASFFLATHYRPLPLLVSLASMQRQEALPRGWGIEMVVAGRPNDPASLLIPLIEGARYICVDDGRAGPKVLAALEASRGEILMRGADDDLSPPRRARCAIQAYKNGLQVTGLSTFWGGGLAFWYGGPVV